MRRVALVICLLAAGAVAQPERSDDRGERPRWTEDPAQVKERIQRRLDESNRVVAALEDALGKLDAGADPEEIARVAELGSRRPDHADDDRKPPPEGPPPSPEAIESFVADHLPDLHRKLESAPEKQREFVHRRIAPRVQEILGLQSSDPALATLRTDELRTSFDLFDAARALHQARREHGMESAQAGDAREHLRGLVVQQWDLRTKVQRHEIATLRQRIEELESRLEDRTNNRQQDIDQALERMERFGRGRRDRDDDDGDRRPRREGDRSGHR